MQQTVSVSRGTRILVALTIVAWGLAAAFVFQRATPTRVSSEANRPESLVSRGEPAWARNESRALPLPVVRLQSSASPTSPPSAAPTLLTGSAIAFSAMDTAAAPPKLARSFPEPSEPIASRWGAMLGLTSPDRGATTQSGKTHRVVDGDTLKALARRYLGNSDRSLEIYEANRDMLPNPEVLPIGAELRIPQSQPKSPTLTPDGSSAPLSRPDAPSP